MARNGGRADRPRRTSGDPNHAPCRLDRSIIAPSGINTRRRRRNKS